MSEEPLFYAKGNRIFQRPIEKVRPDGTRATTMNFAICEISEYLNEGAAQQIVDMLNAGHEVLTARAAASARAPEPGAPGVSNEPAYETQEGRDA